jgi:hypothetical protein
MDLRRELERLRLGEEGTGDACWELERERLLDGTISGGSNAHDVTRSNARG